MNTLIESPLFESLYSSVLPPVLDGMLKGLILLTLIGLVALGLRKASASARHSVWLAGLVGVLALPLLAMHLPGWKVLPETWLPAVENPGITLAVPETSNVSVVDRSMVAGVVPVELMKSSADATGSTISFPSENVELPIATEAGFGGGVLSLGQWIALLWMAGAILLLARLLMSRLGVARLARRTRRVTGGFLEDEMQELCAQLGIRRRVDLLLSHQRAIPMTWGIYRARVLLPSEAANWKPEKRRAVLLHELAHVVRRDCLSQLIGQITLAFHWFNPLVWVAVWRLSIEREYACDDRVIGNGIDPPDYAELILSLSAAFPVPHLCGPTATAMAKPAGLEKRLRGILNPGRNRRSPRLGVVLAGAGCLALILCPLAMIRAEGEKKKPRESAGRALSFYEITTDSLTLEGTQIEAVGDTVVIRSIASENETTLDAVSVSENGHVIVPNSGNEESYRIRVGYGKTPLLLLAVDGSEENGTVLLGGVREEEGKKLLVKDQSRSDNRTLMIEQLEKLRSQLAPQVREQPIELRLDLSGKGDFDERIVLGGLLVEDEPTRKELDQLYRQIAEELARISNRLDHALKQGKEDLLGPEDKRIQQFRKIEIQKSDARDAASKAEPNRPVHEPLGAKPRTQNGFVSAAAVTAQKPIRIDPMGESVSRQMGATNPEDARQTRFVRRTEITEAPGQPATNRIEPYRTFAAMGQTVPAAADLYKLSVPLSGIVSEAPVKPGDRVKKGQVLLQLDDRRAGNDLAIAKKQLDVAKATIGLKTVEYELSKSEQEKVKELHKEGASSSSEVDAFQRKVITAQISLEVKKAEVAVAVSQLSQAEITVQQHRIVAPVDGIVVSVQHKQGEYANAGVPAVILRAVPAKKTVQIKAGGNGSSLGGGSVGGTGFGYESKVGLGGADFGFPDPEARSGNRSGDAAASGRGSTDSNGESGGQGNR